MYPEVKLYWTVWHFGHCFFRLIAAPALLVVIVCSAGGGVSVLSAVGDDIVCSGVIMEVRVVVIVVLSIIFLVDKFVKQ